MRVLADFHHEDLYHSLHLLFEKRLGWELYRQIGTEWYHNDFWMVYNHPDTANQYLGIHLTEEWAKIRERNAGMYCTMPNETAYEEQEGIYFIPDYVRGCAYKGITFEKFKEMRFDIVVSSMPPHIERFNRLIAKYQPGAKHIFQVGNNWSVSGFNVKNILSSSKKANPGKDQNFVFYHQEFDLGRFKHIKCSSPRSVLNMMHLLKGAGLTKFNEFKTSMPNWRWSAHGSGNPDGPILTENIPESFQQHGFLWHYKREGDGFGYNAFNALASGRPIITHKSFFSGMTLEPLLVDGKTCINLDGRSKEEVINLLEAAASDHDRWAEEAHAHFKSVVDYEAEAERIKVFLQNLK